MQEKGNSIKWIFLSFSAFTTLLNNVGTYIHSSMSNHRYNKLIVINLKYSRSHLCKNTQNGKFFERLYSTIWHLELNLFWREEEKINAQLEKISYICHIGNSASKVSKHQHSDEKLLSELAINPWLFEFLSWSFSFLRY